MLTVMSMLVLGKSYGFTPVGIASTVTLSTSGASFAKAVMIIVVLLEPPGLNVTRPPKVALKGTPKLPPPETLVVV